MCAHDESEVVFNAGATASLVCFKWLGRRNSHLQKMGTPKVNTYPKLARFELGDGIIGDVRSVADIAAGIAGRRGTFTVFALGADIAALLYFGAFRDAQYSTESE